MNVKIIRVQEKGPIRSKTYMYKITAQLDCFIDRG
jgi:hypothetical protein